MQGLIQAGQGPVLNTSRTGMNQASACAPQPSDIESASSGEDHSQHDRAERELRSVRCLPCGTFRFEDCHTLSFKAQNGAKIAQNVGRTKLILQSGGVICPRQAWKANGSEGANEVAGGLGHAVSLT